MAPRAAYAGLVVGVVIRRYVCWIGLLSGLRDYLAGGHGALQLWLE
ncbi:hypothetical protein [Paludibacterium denitrificans]|uniref:Uncharacterized protein n=1 Tax=Paludibacterium denitrificans TaxID=2675226 RepID=A0A844GAE9_9NEIS|nr:hypothetical protein [Paludibacterium denitrificans]MTD32271.1 hypothetical protein [Paludibacterium denitrificans]